MGKHRLEEVHKTQGKSPPLNKETNRVSLEHFKKGKGK
jgi:hypothetical protein